jgi:hypothetical protein
MTNGAFPLSQTISASAAPLKKVGYVLASKATGQLRAHTGAAPLKACFLPHLRLF